MQKDLTELVMIVDRSGSMSDLTDVVIKGYNSLLKEMKDSKKNINVTTIFFNDSITILNENASINEIKRLTKKDYIPQGCTALLDSIGKGISIIDNKYKNKKDQPSRILISIMTDGYENDSKEYSYKTIKSLIESRTKKGYEFLFQAGNIDVMKEADSLGIKRDNAIKMECCSAGIGRAFNKVSGCILDEDNIKKNKK